MYLPRRGAANMWLCCFNLFSGLLSIPIYYPLCFLFFFLADSRILIGSVSRLTLQDMLEERLKGVQKHAQQIKEQAQ